MTRVMVYYAGNDIEDFNSIMIIEYPTVLPAYFKKTAAVTAAATYMKSS